MNKRAPLIREVFLNDLAKYSEWPRRLLSLEPYAVRSKTEEEVLREYQDEKWGRLLQQFQLLEKPTLNDVERLERDPHTLAPYYDNGRFYLANPKQVVTRHLELYAQVLAPYTAEASCLVELGAGYGSKIFGIAQQNGFSRLPLIAGEYTEAGRELISRLSSNLRKSIDVGHCDFRKLELNDIEIPENAIIFTSYAVHYVPELSHKFIGFLSRLKPKVVVHFEPCYEYYNNETLHKIMCRRYTELNDYNRNLVCIIDAAQKQNIITARVRENVIGANPFMPISVIEWEPHHG